MIFWTDIRKWKKSGLPDRCMGSSISTKKKKVLEHVSNAAGVGFFDAQKNVFMTGKLAKMGVEEQWLPQVCTGIEARPFLHGDYLLAGASLCGGKAYALLENFFRELVKEATGQEKSLYKTLEKLAGDGKVSCTGTETKQKLQIETTFDGTRVHPEQSGSITNLCAENFTPAAFVYGTLEGMSRELYQMYQTIQNGTGMKIKRMIGSGNGLRKNPVLCEIVEEMFGAKLVLAECEEEAATGAAVSSMQQ